MSIANKLHKVQYICTLCTPSFRGIFLFSRRDAAILIDDLYPPAAHSGTPAAAPPPLPGLWTRNCSFQGQAAACLIVSAQPIGRGRSPRQRAPRGRARRAGGTYKGRRALAKTGALLRVAVSQIYGAGRGPLVYLDGCPCSASAVSAAGSAWLSCKRRLRCTRLNRRQDKT